MSILFVSQLFDTVTKYLGKQKEERFILAYGFRALEVWLSGSIAFSLWEDRTSWQKDMVEENRSFHGSMEAESKTGRSKGQNILFKVKLSVTYFLQLEPPSNSPSSLTSKPLMMLPS
jgi:hypothetical protein